MKTKLKKNHKPKELRVEEKRQRAFARNVLWPFLIVHSKHINEAKNILQATVLGIQEAYDKKMLEEQRKWSGTKLMEFDIDKTILKREDYKIEYQLIELFANETLATTKNLLQGMESVINSFIKEEMQNRTLDTLKAEFLD